MAPRNWSALLQEMLANIAEKNDTGFEYAVFRSVCRSWRSSVLSTPSSLPPPKLPDFCIEEGKEVCSSDGTVNFSRDLVTNTIYALQPLSQSQASSKLWLIKVEEKRHHVLKFRNVLTGSRLKYLPEGFPEMLNTLDFKSYSVGKEFLFLPEYRDVEYDNEPDLFADFSLDEILIERDRLLPEDRELFHFARLKKVLVCPPKTDGDFVVIGIYLHGQLVVFNSKGDSSWTMVAEEKGPFHDLIMFNSKCYVVDSTGRTFTFNPCTLHTHVVADRVVNGGRKKRFVESKGELFLVDMYIDFGFGPCYADWDEARDPTDYYTTNGMPTPRMFDGQARPNGCKVFKLCNDRDMWIQVESTNESVFFLGEGSSFSIPMSGLVAPSTGNYIVFSDEYYYSYKEVDDELQRGIRVFDMEDGSFGKLTDYPSLLEVFWPPPNWVSHLNSD